MDEIFSAFHMVIVKSGRGWCTLLADEGFEFLSPLYLRCYDKNNPNELFIYVVQLAPLVKPYPLGG